VKLYDIVADLRKYMKSEGIYNRQFLHL